MNTKGNARLERDGACKDEVRQVKVVTWTGAVINLGLSFFKVAAGIIGNSQAIVADGVHSLSDLVTDAAVLIGVKYWSAPPDDTHPHGHRRIETLVTMLIGALLAAVAAGIGYNAVTTLMEPHPGPPRLIALIAALASILSKEALYRWTALVGRRARSSAVIANAWHHRSDALSSIPAALAAAGARFLPGWYFLDHVGAIVVSVFILQAAWKISWPALRELADRGADPEDCRRIEQIALATPGVIEVHKIRTRRSGPGINVDLHVLVHAGLTVAQGHDITTEVKRRLMDEGPHVIDVITHLEPHEPPDRIA